MGMCALCQLCNCGISFDVWKMTDCEHSEDKVYMEAWHGGSSWQEIVERNESRKREARAAKIAKPQISEKEAEKERWKERLRVLLAEKAERDARHINKVDVPRVEIVLVRPTPPGTIRWASSRDKEENFARMLDKPLDYPVVRQRHAAHWERSMICEQGTL